MGYKYSTQERAFPILQLQVQDSCLQNPVFYPRAQYRGKTFFYLIEHASFEAIF
jgi:hypothetical protein